MSMLDRLLALATVMPLSACSTPATAPPAASACNAYAIQPYVGQVATSDMIDDAGKAAGAKLVRELKPKAAATLDDRVERLNMMLDDDGKIVSAACG